jgi:uncharacterized RDD family membrane protein YckC
MSDDRLLLKSATGVNLALNIAGPGSRSYAFIIDWHIRLLIAGAWLLAAGFLLGLNLNPRTPGALLGLVPAAIIYFLYHPILEVAMRGRTPGKRMAGLVLVNRHGVTPSTSALLIRNMFRLIDCLPAFYALGLSVCILTENRVRIGDLAAGTLLVIEDAAAGQSLSRVETLLAGSRLPIEVLELADQLVERWPSLQQANRMTIARSLLARVEAGSDRASLSTLSDAQLHERVRGLLDNKP